MTGLATPDTIPALLHRMADRRGSHAAIVMRGQTRTYGELEAESADLARALLAAGAGKGTRIGLLAPDGILWITLFLAALRIGALVTAISTFCTPPELAHILRHSDCRFLIGARRFLRHDFAVTLEEALPALASGRRDRLHLVEAPYLRSVWFDDADDLEWAGSSADFADLADGPDAPDRVLLAAAEHEVAPGDDAVVVYTSGSTTQPKAVVHRQQTLVRHARELARNFVLKPEDRMMVLLPAFWAAGMSMAMQVLTTGATLVYPDTPGTDDALDMIERFGVTRVNAWGDRQPALVKAAAARGIDLSHIPDLGHFTDGEGRPLPPKISMFGMTESFSAHSAELLDQRLPEDKEASCGRAIGGYERRVVDPATGREVPPGEVGELQIRGPMLMSGFYKARRSEVFSPDGFYPTKDLVSIDAEGWLFPAGRLSDMIKTRGANVSRLEVEAALDALPEVEVSVVAGLPDEELGEIVVAAVVPAAGCQPGEAELQQALRTRLSSFKVPRRIVFIGPGDVPRTATGKVRLSEVSEMISGRLGSRT